MKRNQILIVGSILVVLITMALIAWLRTPPQMGRNDDVFKTVDALYTAVRNHDEPRLTQCEAKLKSYQDGGQLPKAAATRLQDYIDTARKGNWDSATESLYDFMTVQRKE
ncbi:hypothetical protein BH11PLA2_BH11PLA2_30850 [soil metagenome]